MPPVFSKFKSKSQSWDYFSTTGTGDKKCVFCGAVYKPHATRLTKHIVSQCKKVPIQIRNRLNNHKPIERANADIETQLTESTLASSSSASHNIDITPTATSYRFFDHLTPTENEELCQLLSKAIHVTGAPFMLVEHPLWLKFFKKLRPSFRPPSRKAVGGKFIDSNYESMKNNVTSKINETELLHLQCDGWTNTKREPVMNFILNTPKPLFVKSVQTEANRHTASYLCSIIENVMKDYGPEKFVVLIGDNAANIQNAYDLIRAKYPHVVVLRCIDHTLHLLCKDIARNGKIETLLSSTNEIVSHIKGSHILTGLFNELKDCALTLHGKTRWGSYETSLTSLLRNKFNLQTLAINPEATTLSSTIKRNILDEDFWSDVKAVQQLMQPIVKAILQLEGDGVYMHMVHAEVKEVLSKTISVLEKHKDCPIFSTEKETIESNIETRISTINHPFYLAAVLLDPSNKGVSLSEEEHLSAIDFICQLWRSWKKRNSTATEGELEINVAAEGADDDILNEIMSYITKSDFFGHNVLWAEQSLSMPPLSWWKGLCRSKNLSTVAQMVLSAPVSSSATERSFKTFSDIHTKKRNRLSTEKAAKRMIW